MIEKRSTIARLRIASVWWERQADPMRFVEPLARGIFRKAKYLEVEDVSLEAVGPPAFRSSLEQNIKLLRRS